jgi:hypothetical protein
LFVSSNQYAWIMLITIYCLACPPQRFLIQTSPV